LSPDQLEQAKAFDEDLAKARQLSDKSDYAWIILNAQKRLANWGYGTKFTGEADAATAAAFRDYQEHNHLRVTANLDGETKVLMDADEEALDQRNPDLPKMYLSPSAESYLRAEGVFRDTSTGQGSNPILIECGSQDRVCLVVESTPFLPSVVKMRIRSWTNDRVIADQVAECYTDQLRIERANKTVAYTSVRTKESCAAPLLEATGGKLKLPTYTQELLVDGLSVWNDRFDKYSKADRRITRLSRSLESILHPANGAGGTNKKR
jgi:peptidoglycan hydrolase-like protein with peptidoglycan-binding domain